MWEYFNGPNNRISLTWLQYLYIQVVLIWVKMKSYKLHPLTEVTQ